jgi:diaminopimelate epimerase
MGALEFDKYEGLGNDFVLVEASDAASFVESDARALCDRRFGVGGDGVLVVTPAREAGADARMKVVNADGSVPEMCGNGLRCVALHIARARGLRQAELTVETDAGLRRCAVESDPDDPSRATVTVDMGVVRVDSEVSLEIDGEWIDFVLADAGNPHAVSFRPSTRADFERIGPAVATHARFPNGTNVELAQVGPTGLDVVVWERGVGPTLACGTGACATLAVAVVRGLVPAGVMTEVRLPGGALQIRYEAESGRVIMRGPARHVFTGRRPERR